MSRVPAVRADGTNRPVTAKNTLVYVGTYTGGGSEGIYIGRLDMATGALELIGVAAAENPSYLAIDADRLRLYAVNEVSEYGGRPGGSVSAYAIQPSSGELAFINREFSHGKAPCYLSLDQTGHYLFAVNYLGGNVVVFPLQRDGALMEPSDIIAHTGSGPDPRRQDGPHPHAIVLDPANRHAFVPDLGLDRVMVYRFGRDRGRLLPNERPWAEAMPGSGPRHMVFHPNGTHAYVINELNSTVTAYEYDPEQGALSLRQTVATVPEGYQSANIAADIHLTPSGNILLASNRGHNSIACYAVDRETGELLSANFVHTQGKTPRGFAVDPTSTYVLVANQDSHTIVTFVIDEAGGTLVPTRKTARIPSPVCLKVVG
jgi:6-phosphogluconolactonase